MLKSQFKGWLLAMVVLAVYSIALKSDIVINMFIPMIGIMSCLSSFTYDRMYRCEEFIAAMPLGRKKIVLSKYVFLVLLDLGLALFAVLILFFTRLSKAEALWETAAVITGTLGATLFLQFLILPLIYKWGPEKARILFLILAVSPYLLLTLAQNMNLSFDEGLLLSAAKMLPVILIAAAIISFRFSVWIYQKKDF